MADQRGKDQLVIAGAMAFNSRLIVGTGKYRSFQENGSRACPLARIWSRSLFAALNLTDRSKESLLDYVDRDKIFILPCITAGLLFHGGRSGARGAARQGSRTL